jgi:hypothetical protein
VQLQHPANDGITTATDGRALYVVAGRRRCSIPDALGDDPAVFEYEASFPLRRLVRPAIRPVLQIAAAAHASTVAVHAATVTVDDGAILVAGWSESGKTEVALALAERGGAFLTDKWTLVGTDLAASGFPVSVGVRGWVLPYLPTLRRAVPLRARAQLRGAAVAAAALRPVRVVGSGRAAALDLVLESAARAVSLADRAAFDADEIRSIYHDTADATRRVPVRAVVFLETVPAGGGIRAGDPSVVARQLAVSAAYERRPYFELLQRAAFGLTHRPVDRVERSIELDEAILRRVFESIPPTVVRTPFPADPRPVADRILSSL